MIPNAQCQSCNWIGPADYCGPLRNAWERVQPGDVMPAGECPVCNASAMIVEDGEEPSLKIETRRLAEQATHFPRREPAHNLAAVMRTLRPEHRYGVQHVSPHGHRVAVWRFARYPQILPDGYLRLLGT